MGFFDFLRSKPNLTIADPVALRDAMFDAVRRNDTKRFQALYVANQPHIAQHAGTWNNATDRNMDDAALQAHINLLGRLAEALAKLGHPQLLDKLTGKNDPDNVFNRWNEQFQQATALAKDFRHAEAIEVAQSILLSMRNLRGSGLLHHQAMAHGMLGHLYFSINRLELAEGNYAQALSICQKSADAEGIAVYTQFLYDLCRYKGDPTAAAAFADQRAAIAGQTRDAAAATRWTTLAALCRAGEPANRVCAVVGDVTYELDDVPSIRENGKVSFIYVRNRPTLPLSEQYRQRALQHMSADRKDDGLADLREAVRVDPYNPAAHAHFGQALMMANRIPEAVDAYATAEEIAPGWYQVRSDLWLAQQIVAGSVPQEVFLLLLFVENEGVSARERLQIAQKLLEIVPHLAASHAAMATALEAAGRPADAAESLRQALACHPEPDLHTRLLLRSALAADNLAKKQALWRQAVDLNGNIMASAMARFALANARA